METLGIDIGGSGIKGALVDTTTGRLASKRQRVETPRPATPEAVIEAIRKIVKQFHYEGRIGVGFPGIIVDGRVLSAANIHAHWINFSGREAIAQATSCPITLLNDADAAGLAEMRFGAGRGHAGVTMIFTLGTGIGSAMFVDGRTVPNLELGHLYLPGHDEDAERYTSDRARQDLDLSWKEWGRRLQEYFSHIEFLFSPQLIIIGGGVSKKHKKFLKHIKISAPVIPAELRNQAGIIGAAVAAAESAAEVQQ